METDIENALAHVLSKSGPNIGVFLDFVFEFLRKRTDFYYVSENPELENIGFQKGFAESLTRNSFFKHQNIYESQLQKSSKCNSSNVPPLENEVEISEVSATDDLTSSSSSANQNAAMPQSCSSTATEVIGSSNNAELNEDSYPVAQNGDIYNGASHDNYRWSQTHDDVDIKVDLPPHICNKSQFTVKFTSQSLIIQISEEESGNFQEFVSGELFSKIDVSSSYWNFDSKQKQLQIFLEKLTKSWWKKLLTNEECELDLAKLDTSTNLHDLPADEQSTIDGLRYDQMCKAQGLPTRQEQKNHNLLRKAWNCEGSPFKGTPFDPSVVKFS